MNLAHADHWLIGAVRSALAEAADPSKAPAMQAYMKSAMPYRGVFAPELRRTLRAVFDAHRLPSFEAWRDTTLLLWREAEYREERYGAIALTGHGDYRDYQVLEALPLYEEMVVTGAWWDYVDDIASHRLGALLRIEPEAMSAEMRRWSCDADMWKRRSSILCQLGFKAETDLALLYDCIERNLDDREFFIRKAIGWALRQYAWTDPEEVVRYVEEHRDRLSPLSKREALKNVLKSGRIAAIP